MKKIDFIQKYGIIILSALLVIIMLGSQTYLYHYAQNKSHQIIALKELKQKILYYDEALTMSARVGAYNTNPKWEARYKKLEIQLDETLERVHELAPNVNAILGSEHTSKANEKLVEMEKRAFSLSRQGKNEEAVSVLFSPVYESYKEDYFNGMESLNKVLDAEAKVLFDSVFYIGIGRNVAVVLILIAMIYLALIKIKTHKQVERLAELKSNFLDTMSHEIRTPMNGIIGIAEILTKADIDKENKKYAHAIYNSGRALMQILNDILDVSRLNNKKLKISNERFNLDEVVKSVIDLERPLATEKGLDLFLRYQIEEKSFIGDPIRIQQILTNLVNNAIKFTETGMVMLDVNFATDFDHSTNQKSIQEVEFTVTDTGIGIPQEEQNNIFKNFSQVENSSMRRAGGFGLGLSITKNLVKLMGGTISVTSQLNKGSSFTITIPLQFEAIDKRIHRLFETSQPYPRVLFFGFDVQLNNGFLEFLLAKDIPFLNQDNVSKTFESLKKAKEKNQSFLYLFFDLYEAEKQSIMLAKLIKNDISLKETKVIFIGDKNQQQSASDWDCYLDKKDLMNPDLVLNKLEEI